MERKRSLLRGFLTLAMALVTALSAALCLCPTVFAQEGAVTAADYTAANFTRVNVRTPDELRRALKREDDALIVVMENFDDDNGYHYSIPQMEVTGRKVLQKQPFWSLRRMDISDRTVIENSI